MIIGELAVGVMILLEKEPSRHHIFEDQQFWRNTQKFIQYQKTKVARRRKREEQPCGEATLAHSCHRSLMYIVVPKNLSQGDQR
jgi:hypothetical protein